MGEHHSRYPVPFAYRVLSILSTARNHIVFEIQIMQKTKIYLVKRIQNLSKPLKNQDLQTMQICYYIA